MGKSIIDRVEQNGYRVEYNNGNYKVYEYSNGAYLFYGYYTKSELKDLL